MLAVEFMSMVGHHVLPTIKSTATAMPVLAVAYCSQAALQTYATTRLVTILRASGGAIAVFESDDTITNNAIENNTADDGGGIYVWCCQTTISHNKF